MCVMRWRDESAFELLVAAVDAGEEERVFGGEVGVEGSFRGRGARSHRVHGGALEAGLQEHELRGVQDVLVQLVPAAGDGSPSRM